VLPHLNSFPLTVISFINNSAGVEDAKNLDLHVWTEGSDLRVDVSGEMKTRESSSMHRLSVTEIHFDLNVTSNAPESSGTTAQLLSALMTSTDGIPWLDQDSGLHQTNFKLAIGDIDFARSAEASRALQVSLTVCLIRDSFHWMSNIRHRSSTKNVRNVSLCGSNF
jgi:hypothetical protein